jgi:hypothetical protein
MYASAWILAPLFGNPNGDSKTATPFGIFSEA